MSRCKTSIAEKSKPAHGGSLHRIVRCCGFGCWHKSQNAWVETKYDIVIDAEKNRCYTDPDKCTLKPRVKLQAHGEDGKGSPENGNQKECPTGTAHEQRC